MNNERAQRRLLAAAVSFFAILVLGMASPSEKEARGDKTDRFRLLRERMVREQIESRGVPEPAVLRAMEEVPRHEFVPERLRGSAYDDRPLPIGYGQTISQPYIVAYMTRMLDLQPGDKVLEVGTGSGYQAAILSRLTDEVYTVEIIPQLAAAAGERFKRLGYDTIHARVGDGYYGWKEPGPYDAIIVTAAATHVPPPLIEQLKDGGKMVIPVGSTFFVQTLMLVEKEEGKVKTADLMGVRFVPLTGGPGNTVKSD